MAKIILDTNILIEILKNNKKTISEVEKFFAKYRGFEAVSKLAEIKNELSQQLHKKVDFVSIENSNQKLVDMMKKELIYV